MVEGSYDGSLKFDTKIDQGGFESGRSSLTKAMDRLTKAVDTLSAVITKEFDGAGEAALEASKEIESIGEAAGQSENKIKSLQEQMDAIHVEDNTRSPVSGTPQEAPVAVPASPEALNYDPKAMAAVFGEAAAEIHNYAEAVTEYGNQAGMTMNTLSQEAAAAGSEVSDAAARGTEETEQAYVSLKDAAINALKNAPAVFRMIPTVAARELGKVPGIAKKAFSQAADAVKGFAKALGSGLANSAKQAVANLRGVEKSSNGVSKCILKLSNMFKLMLTRMAMRAAIQGVKDGMQNLVQYSDSANRAMSNLVSGMTYLKNSFAAAFAPVLSVVAPILNTLINMLATAINYVNQFFAALSGSKTFVRAKKVNQDYAKSIGAAGGAAKQAGKNAKKALAPFDELNELQENASGGGGGGGGGGGAGAADMFETVAIEQGISDFAKELTDLFAANDWEGVGHLLGQKINEAVQSFTDYISWGNVGEEITGFVTAFTAILNSLVGTIDWYRVGIMMGTGINTLANTLYLLLTRTDWQLLGTAFAQGLNGMVHTVDWDLFGRTFGAYLQAKIAALYGFVTTADWASIGQAIGDALNGVTGEIDWAMLGLAFLAELSGLFTIAGNFATTYDWSGFGSSLALSLSTFFQSFDWAGAGTAISDLVIGLLDALLVFLIDTDWWAFGDGVATALEHIDWGTVSNRLFAAIGAAIGGLGAVLGGLIGDGVASAGEYFKGKIEECGGDVVGGILKGILDAMGSIATWIKNNVFEPFIDGLLKAFGIGGGVSEMEKFGEYLWDGFCDGVKKFFDDPGAFIREHITDPFVNGIKNFLGIHSPSTVLEEIGGNTVSGFNAGVEKNQNTTQTTVQSWAKGVAGWFSEKLGISNNDSKESEEWANSIMSGYNGTIGKNYTKSQSVMETWAESVRDWYVGKNDSKGVNETAWRKFADAIIGAFAAGVQSGNQSSRAPIESWARNIKNWFWGASYTGGANGLYQEFYNMAKLVNQGFAAGIGAFSHLARNAMQKWGSEVVASAKSELDIHSPSRVAYSIAEYFVEGFNNGLLGKLGSSVSAAKQWLGSVTGVFDGVELGVPVGIDIPNATSYLPRIASGTVVPPRAGEYAAAYRDRTDSAAAEGMLETMQRVWKDMIHGEAEGGDIHLTVNLDGKVVYDNVVRRNESAMKQNGRNPLLA